MQPFSVRDHVELSEEPIPWRALLARLPEIMIGIDFDTGSIQIQLLVQKLSETRALCAERTRAPASMTETASRRSRCLCIDAVGDWLWGERMSVGSARHPTYVSPGSLEEMLEVIGVMP